MRKLLLTSLLATGMGAPLAAQSLPGNMYIDGSIIYEYLNDNAGNDANTFSADLTLGLAPGFAGSAPIGAELYLFYMDLDSIASASDWIGGVVYYDSSFGRFSVGTPKSTIRDYVDTFSVSPNLDHYIFGASFAGLLSVYIPAAGITSYGARFDGQSGNFSYGASYHYIDDADISGYTIAGSYQYNNYTFGLGVEDLDGSTNAFASAHGDFGDLGATLHLVSIDGGSTGYGVTVSYDVMPELMVEAGYFSFDGGSDISVIRAEYNFYQGAFIGAQYQSELLGSDPIYSVYLGYDF